jgi:DNA-binding NtrC family response regulator
MALYLADESLRKSHFQSTASREKHGSSFAVSNIMERRVALIVDDHADTAEMLKIFLQSEQLDSLAYHDFDDAYFALASLRPCIALIDLQVPGKMKAPEFIQKVRREHPTLPIVIVSADARAKVIADALHTRFVFKPFGADDVVEIAKLACSAHASKRANFGQ